MNGLEVVAVALVVSAVLHVFLVFLSIVIAVRGFRDMRTDMRRSFEESQRSFAEIVRIERAIAGLITQESMKIQGLFETR